MKKLQDKMRKLRKNNKGFTLVELIIVIAIIAILATVFAPMYTKYVEDARETNDVRLAESIMQAAVTSAIDPEFEGSGSIEVTLNPATPELTIAAATDASSGDDLGVPGNLKALIVSILPETEMTTESTKGAGELSFTLNTSTGVITDVTGWDDLLD